MTNEQIQALQAAAENIGAETWHSEGATVWNDEYEVNDEYCKDLIACCENVNNVSVHAQFIAAANPAAILSLLAERESDKALIAELQGIRAAAEKLVRCKGRFHSEQNYRALAALFGVNTPDLSPLDGEARTLTVSIKPPTIGRAYSALNRVWTVQEVSEALSAAGITLVVGGERS